MSRKKIIATEFRCWLVVALWIVILFLTIPLARTLQGYIRSAFGDHAFGYIVITIIVISTLLLFVRIKHTTIKLKPKNIIWILLCAAFLVAYTLSLWSNPVEAIHFIQYGVLAIFLFHALSWRHPNTLIYIAIVLAAASVGIIDETLQWLMPNRVWGLDDIGINIMAAIVVCVAIAKGIQPKVINRPINSHSVQLVLWLAIFCLSLLIFSFANTPDTINWYSKKISPLSFLSHNGHIMSEYGYRYKDEEIGLFRSRFSPNELKQHDRKYAVDAAQKLDAAPFLDDYKEFITRYSPMTNSFLHELRVHLNRRDYYLKTGKQTKRYSSVEQQRRLKIAYFENKIVEKYFPSTLKKSSFTLNQKDSLLMKNSINSASYYESPVSQSLITVLSKKQLLSLLIVTLLGLLVLRVKLKTRFNYGSL
ncbi:MAG: VanZ family protein [Gammaproteobacteria bacterium]|nr:VanZ family protein [Gammaproteobacteria bacterium]